MKKIRVGIDVGGTFTHAVAVDNQTLEVIDQAVSLTTHSAAEGVAKGIIDVFKILLSKLSKDDKIIFIAHSTTQATNALLEGDVSAVGILGMAKGIELVKAKMDTRIPKMEIAPHKFLHTHHEFVNLSGGFHEEEVRDKISRLMQKGSVCIVASESFSVDDPEGENKVIDLANKAGLLACATHQMTGLYGLKVRTRTAVINASILPKMLDTANLTEASIKKAEVQSPLMIMRSDGGVMTIDEVRKRPLLTLLSGPAAGIAAALMYIRATDAVFLEVGGTSTDISVIRDGKAMIRSAHIGGHTTYLKTLDSRTLGIAGGSLVCIEGDKIKEVGPRSAHIAGLAYASFSDPDELEEIEIIKIRPKEDDPDYLALKNKGGKLFGVTTTCAANFLGYIKEKDYAFGNLKSLDKAFKKLGEYFKKEPAAIAEEIMEKACGKVIPTIKTLIKEYELGDKDVLLIGGGGGSYSIVPYLAKKLNFNYQIAKKAEVISAIGAALALVRETIERNVFEPKDEDINKIHSDAEEAVVKMGADPETVEVQIEVDCQRNILRAIATGSIEFKSQDLLLQDVGEEERKKTASNSLRVAPGEVAFKGGTDFLFVYEGEVKKKVFLFTKKFKSLRIIDMRGTVRLQVPEGLVFNTRGMDVFSELEKIIEQCQTYGDAGCFIPCVFILFGRRILDLSHVISKEQVKTIAKIELKRLKTDEKVVILTQLRKQ